MTSYSFTALPPPLGFTVLGEAQDINASGEVVGYYQDNSDDFSGAFHGFAYSGSIFAILDVPGAYDTVVYAINDSGQLAGFYDGPGASVHLGFFASNGIFTTLDVPGAYSTIANAINASGDVAGNYGYFNDGIRSEEHTSELQSRLHLVCRLLLEKKQIQQRARGWAFRPARRVWLQCTSQLA